MPRYTNLFAVSLGSGTGRECKYPANNSTDCNVKQLKSAAVCHKQPLDENSFQSDAVITVESREFNAKSNRIIASFSVLVREKISSNIPALPGKRIFLALNPRKGLGLLRKMVYRGRHECKERDRSPEPLR